MYWHHTVLQILETVSFQLFSSYGHCKPHLRKWIFKDHINKSKSWSTIQGHNSHSVPHFWFHVLALLAMAAEAGSQWDLTWPLFKIAEWRYQQKEKNKTKKDSFCFRHWWQTSQKGNNKYKRMNLLSSWDRRDNRQSEKK